MVVDVNGVRSAPVQLTVVETSPGVFVAGENGVGHVAAAAVTGPGQIEFINAQNPARRGQEFYFYMTGEGQTSPAGVTGQIATAAKIPLQEVKARIAGIDAEVVYYGTAAGIVSGVIQVNVRVPNPTDPALIARLTGLVPLQITVGNTSAQSGVMLAIRP
jgi:uncharacterized protein (TIGR03437 family)